MVNGTNGSTWEEQTKAKLREAKQKEAQLKRETAHWSDYANSLARVLELDQQHRGIQIDGQQQIDPESLRTKSIRQALIDIAAANSGLLVVISATQILVDAGVFKDREHARGSIYAALHYAKKSFKKERPGVYQLLTTPKVPLAGM